MHSEMYADGANIDPVFTNLECLQLFEESGILSTSCYAALNTNVTIDCQYTSNPSSNVTVNIIRTLENVESVSTRIVITNVTRDNQGSYQCDVTNIFVSGIIVTRSLRVSLFVTEGMTLTLRLPPALRALD